MQFFGTIERPALACTLGLAALLVVSTLVVRRERLASSRRGHRYDYRLPQAAESYDAPGETATVVAEEAGAALSSTRLDLACWLRRSLRWLGDGGLDGSFAGAHADPEPDQEATDDSGGDVEQAGLGAESAAGKEGRAALLDGDELRSQIVHAANRESEDSALEEVPGDV